MDKVDTFMTVWSNNKYYNMSNANDNIKTKNKIKIIFINSHASMLTWTQSLPYLSQN